MSVRSPFDSILRQLESGITIDQGYESVDDVKNALLEYMGASVQSDVPTLDYSVKDAIFKPTLKGKTLTGYAAVWFDDKGQEFIDSYNDHVSKHSFSSTITELKQQAKAQGHDYLCPLLWNHIRPRDGGLIGKVTDIAEDNIGVKFTSILADVPLAEQAYAHTKNNTAASSYGYDSLDHEYMPHPTKKYTNVRRIKKLRLHEISVIPAHSGAANPYTHLEAKHAAMQHKITHDYLLSLQMRYYECLLDGLLRTI